jgi:hypothetical protein
MVGLGEYFIETVSSEGLGQKTGQPSVRVHISRISTLSLSIDECLDRVEEDSASV